MHNRYNCSNTNKIYFNGKIRIIGGQWRSRKLSVLKNINVRPTIDRLREILFNWLKPVIHGSHCLDCFAGSGVLGIEALSRSATSVILLEHNKLISSQLMKNINSLQARQAKVITTDSLLWLSKYNHIFNIVFIDPPFYHGMVSTTVEILERYHHLSNNAWIYIETEIKKEYDLKIPNNWKLYRKKITKHVSYLLYIRNNI